tara:strand:- start:1618 stop:2265 length:648 start_codon:yes stop_codon:yes gene_type:complete
MSKLKTVWDAVIYYGGSNFVNGKHEQHHTHVISIHNTEKIGTDYASDIGMNAIICGIKTYNQCIDDMSTNYGRSSLKHLAIWQAGLKESKEALDIIVKKPLVYTQEMADNGELPSVGMTCMYGDINTDNYILVEVMYISEWVIVIKQVSDGYGKDVEIAKHTDNANLKPIDTRTKKEKAIDEYIQSQHHGLESLSQSIKTIMKSAFEAGTEWKGE